MTTARAQVMRHSYFTINQLVVDDLVELMCTGRRAEQRTGRLRRRDADDVFRFLLSELSTDEVGSVSIGERDVLAAAS